MIGNSIVILIVKISNNVCLSTGRHSTIFPKPDIPTCAKRLNFIVKKY